MHQFLQTTTQSVLCRPPSNLLVRPRQIDRQRGAVVGVGILSFKGTVLILWNTMDVSTLHSGTFLQVLIAKPSVAVMHAACRSEFPPSKKVNQTETTFLRESGL
eukprot:1580337-Amphidinium_carterae.1